MLFFEFPENASWNDKRDCVEFSVILGPYEGTVRVPRRVFQGLLDPRSASDAGAVHRGVPSPAHAVRDDR
jgi:hypothetical protein